MKTLAFAALLATQVNAAIFKSDSLIVLERQKGAIYSDLVVRQAANSSSVVTIYIDPTKSNTRTERVRTLAFIHDKIKQYSPKTIYISEEYARSIDLSSFNGRKVSIDPQHSPERNSANIIQFVKASGLPDTFYILYDDNASSKIEAYEYKAFLSAEFDPKNIKIINISTIQELRKWFKARLPEGIVLNCMTLLFDAEISKYKFAGDIKRELTSTNKKFFDIGFQNTDYNEALVIIPDYSTLYQKTFKGEAIELKSIALANTQRIRALGKFTNLADAFKTIDGTTQ